MSRGWAKLHRYWIIVDSIPPIWHVRCLFDNCLKWGFLDPSLSFPQLLDQLWRKLEALTCFPALDAVVPGDLAHLLNADAELLADLLVGQLGVLPNVAGQGGVELTDVFLRWHYALVLCPFSIRPTPVSRPPS